MQKLILLIVMSLVVKIANCQNQPPPIILEVNKTVSLISFLNHAAIEVSSEKPMTKLIHNTYGGDEKFNQLIKDYSRLNLSYGLKRREYPASRYSVLASWDLIWIAASHSSNIDDFKDRIIGILPMETYSKFISILKGMEPYFDRLIWENEIQSNKRIEIQLAPYIDDIQQIFLKAAKFYGTNWDPNIAFITSLVPLPVKLGEVSGKARGNVLISEYRTEIPDDYILRLGVIIHEMCHIIYYEQSLRLQHEMDSWFKESDSEYSIVAYSFIDEALATAIGNAWAHEKIFGELPPLPWYNDPYISDFAYELYPLVLDYMNQNKTMDKDFVNAAINAFSHKFPNSLYDPEFLLLSNDIQFYTTANSQKQGDEIDKTMRNYFNYNGWFYRKINDENLRRLNLKGTTKIFLIDRQISKEDLNKINKHIKGLDIKTPIDHIDIFKDDSSESTIIVIHTDIDSNFENALRVLKKQDALKPGKRIAIKN